MSREFLTKREVRLAGTQRCLATLRKHTYIDLGMESQLSHRVLIGPHRHVNKGNSTILCLPLSTPTIQKLGALIKEKEK